MKKSAVPQRVTLLVNAANATPKRRMERDDLGVVGIWSVEVDAGIDPAARAEAALDVFHESVAVDVLDDFEFDVVDPESARVLARDFDHESYSLSGSGAVAGKLADKPLVVRAFRVRGVGGPGEEVDCGVATVACQSVAAARQLSMDLLWDERLTCAGLRMVVESER